MMTELRVIPHHIDYCAANEPLVGRLFREWDQIFMWTCTGHILVDCNEYPDILQALYSSKEGQL